MSLINKILEFFRGRKGIKKKPGPLAAHIIEEVFRKNLLLLTGKEFDVDVRKLAFASFEDELLKKKTALAVEYFGKSDIPNGCFITSEIEESSIYEIFNTFHIEQYENDNQKLIFFSENLSGNLYRIFDIMNYLEGEVSEGGFSQVIRDYRGEREVESLWWRMSGFIVFAVSFEDVKAYMLFNTDRYVEINNAITNEDVFSLLLDDLLEIYIPGKWYDAEKPPVEVLVQNKNEMLLADIFVPQRFAYGDADFNSSIRSIHIVNDFKLDQNSDFPLKAEIKIDKYSVVVYYVLEGLNREMIRTVFGNDFNPLFKKVFSYLQEKLKLYSGRPVSIIDIKSSQHESSVEEKEIISVFKYSSMAAGNLFNINVLIPVTLINMLAVYNFSPFEIAIFKSNTYNMLLQILSLNNNLYSRYFIDVKKKIMKYPVSDVKNDMDNYIYFALPQDQVIPSEAIKIKDVPFLLFYQFLNIVPGEDMMKVLQVIMTSGTSLNEMSCYFFAGIDIIDSEKGMKRRIHVPVYDFDNRMFLSRIPERWRGTVEDGIGHALQRNEFIMFNEKAMTDLLNALKEDRILLSRKGGQIFREGFIRPFQWYYKKMSENLNSEIILLMEKSEDKRNAGFLNYISSRSGHDWLVPAVYGIDVLSDSIIKKLKVDQVEEVDYQLKILEDKIKNEEVLWKYIFECKTELKKIFQNQTGYNL